MVDFTYAKKADIQYMYGSANENGKAMVRMHHAQFHDRRMPYHRIFQSFHRKHRETNLFLFTRPRLFFMWTSKNTCSRKSEAAVNAREIPGIFERVRQSLYRRC